MSASIDRRTFLRRGARVAAAGMLVPGAAAAVLEACAASGDSTAGPRPRTGGNLTFATEAEIAGLDPRTSAWDATSLLIGRAVYDPLCIQAADGSIAPFLARSVTPNADYTQWTITLRPGIRFHDGSPLDANTVKINIDGYARSPLTGPYLLNMIGTRVIDPLTLVVSMYTPWVPFPSYLTGHVGHMAGLKQLADTSGKAAPVGTGPFVFKEWLPGDHYSATRNPNYWRTGLPYLDSITFRPIPNPPARSNSLLAGDVDLMHSSDAQNVADFRDRAGYGQLNDLNAVLGEPDMNLIMLNTAVPPLNDLRVRRALAFATDRRRAVNTLYNGVNPPSDGPFTPVSPYYGATGYPSFDLGKAKALVADYQKERGPISFQFATVNTVTGRARNELLQSMWRDAGIQTEIVEVDQALLILNAIIGNYQACGWRQFNCPDPDANFAWWSSTTAAPVGKQALNFARVKDAQLDAGLEAGRTQVDPVVRAAAYRLVASRFGALVPFVWLAQSVWIVAAHGIVGGLGQDVLPDGGRARSMISGVISTSQLWRSA
ncbi:MAG TPA: ABC transporter substrate-binding protein [Terriglobales bacterium]|nr:ABC transporter substrate-binding protein [Terriglobales bacterium]